METIVLKFGGSSVADNIRLNLVAEKVIELYNKHNNIVVVLSAQGKTTDKLIKEGKELSENPSEREMDVLLSSGEQMSIAKLSILLNQLGYDAVSLTGWQAGIMTNNVNQKAIIENINTKRILKELSKKRIVIVAGFQGIDENFNITTLGRGGSDTTAVAIAAAINANHCYIFSDVDGVYTSDPNKISEAKKLKNISYGEMLTISSEGAKVLHNRCVEIADKYKVPIITKSTFNNKPGTIISDKIEGECVKSIIKNDNLMYIHLKSDNYSTELFNKIYFTLINNNIIPKNLINNSTYCLDMYFYITKEQFDKFIILINNELNPIEANYFNISKISIVGNGIMNTNTIILKLLQIVKINNLEILKVEADECKISLMFKEKISDNILEQIHNELI